MSAPEVVGCDRCLTEVNVDRRWCLYCSTQLDQENFMQHLEEKLKMDIITEEGMRRQQALLEAQNLEEEKFNRERTNRRVSIKKSLNEKELVAFELFEDILFELQKVNKNGRANPITKAVLNTGAERLVNTFLDED